MKLKLIYGDAAAAQHAVDEALAAHVRQGERAVLLVPEQETVSAERRALQVLPSAAQLTFEVLNFTRLANRTARTVGGLCHHTATAGVCALTMWRVLREAAPMLRRFGEAAGDRRFAEKMLAAGKQCKAYLVSPDALLEAADALPENDPLRAGLFDLGTVLSLYATALTERYDDLTDELTHLAGTLRAHPGLFADTHFYLSSFTDFTAQEAAVIGALLGGAASLTVVLPLPKPHAEGLHLTSPAATEKKLRRMADKAGVETAQETLEAPRPQTAREYLAAHLFDMTADPAPLGFSGDGSVRLNVSASPFEEAEAAAAEIHRLVRAGARYRDIAVVVRDAAAWSGILDATFEKEGIPCYLSVKTDVTLRPLVKLILLALRIALKGWREEDVIEYLKTGLLPVAQDDVDLFEEYLGVWHLRGAAAYRAPFARNPDGYQTAVSARGAHILERANAVRAAMVPPLARLHEALNGATAAAQCRAVYDFLVELDVAARVGEEAKERLAAGERREAQELSRLWNITVGALEEIAETLADLPLSTAEFSDVLHLAFSQTDIGTIPTSSDEVTIGSASLLRADRPRFVLALGLNEGIFPRNVQEDGLLSRAERERLAADFDITLGADNAAAVSDELFYLYRTFSAPREGLWLSYAITDARGAALSPSIAVYRLNALLGEEVNKGERVFTPADPAAEPEALIFTPQAARERWHTLSPAARAALQAWFEEHGAPDAVAALTRPLTEREASVSPAAAQRIFAGRAVSPSRLEKYAACPFLYYCVYVLQLRTEADGTLVASEAGTFIHYVLERVMRALGPNGRAFADCTEEAIAQMVEDAVQHYKSDLAAASGGFTPHAEALFSRLSLLARLIVTDLVAEFADSDFFPAFLELDLTAHGATPTVAAGGHNVPLKGKADRVDVFRHPDGRVFLRVVDYKTGARTFERESVLRGQYLQMPLYLMALCREAQPALAQELGLPADTRFLPAGITYFSSATGQAHTNAAEDAKAALENAQKRLKRDGMWLEDGDVLHAMSHIGNTSIIGGPRQKKTVPAAAFDDLFADLGTAVGQIAANMQQGRAAATPQIRKKESPCNYCDYRAVCRAAKRTK